MRGVVCVVALVASSLVVAGPAGAAVAAGPGTGAGTASHAGADAPGGVAPALAARSHCPAGIGTVAESANRSYGGSDRESVVTATRSDGPVLVGGATTSYTGEPPLRQDGSYDAWVLGLHPNGTEAWNRSYGDRGFEQLRALVATPGGGYYVVAGVENTSTDAASEDPWIVRVDGNGSVAWTRRFRSGVDEAFHGATLDGAGGLRLVGETVATEPDGAEHGQGWLVHLAGNGTVLDERTVGTYTERYGEDDAFYGIERTAEGYLVTGSTSSYTPKAFDAPWVLALDANGTEAWNHTYFEATGGSARDRRIRDVRRRPDGTLLLVGDASSDGEGAWIASVASDGTERWERIYGDSIDRFETLVAVDETGFLLAGSTWACSREDSYADNWLVKLDAELGVKWAGTYGGPGQDQLATALSPTAGELWLVGLRSQYGNGGDVAVRTVPVDPGVPGVTASTHPPRDADADGRYEDVTGDGSFDVIDVATFLDVFDDVVVTRRAAAFDFDGSGSIDVIDVATLLDAL